MYSPADYSAMLADEVRLRAYLDAIAAVVRPGDVVLELGTGPGFFAVAACNAGAAHVYAVEPNEVVGIGPALAAANGCADRITFIHGTSQRAVLPRRADVLIEDMRGVLPLHESRGAALADADARLLVPGARRIPRADTIWAAPCTTPEVLRPDFALRGERLAGIDVSALTRLVRNEWHKARFVMTNLLSAPQAIARLDYARPESLDVHGSCAWTIDASAAITGWCVWFDAELADGIICSNSPASPPAVYAQAFFPLSKPVAVAAGDRVTLEMRVAHAATDPVWTWDTTTVCRNGASELQRQSTLAGGLMNPAELRAMAPDARPAPAPSHAVYSTLLQLADGSRSHDAIATALATSYPDIFRSHADALLFATSRLFAMRVDPSVS